MSSVPLNEVAEVIRGVTFSKAEGSSSKDAGLLPVIRAGSIQGTLLLEEGNIWVPKSKIKEHQLIRKNDIIMCTSSGSADLVGKCAKSEKDWIGSFGAFCAGIRADETKCDSSYLFHFLCTPVFRNWTKSASGVNIKNIRASELANFEIPLPYPDDPEKSLKEQKRIAAILDKADGIRRKRQQAIQLADEFLRSVFLDMFGDPVTNPKGWEVCKFEDLIDLATYGLTVRPNYIEKGIPLISAKEIRTGTLDYSNAPNISESDFDNLSDKAKPSKGDILFSKTGSIGHCAIVESHDLFAVTQNAARIVPDNNKVYSLFLLCFMRTKYFYDLANREAKGNAVKDLQLGTMKSFPVYCPPKAVQEKFISLYRKQVGVINYFEKFSDQDLFSSLSQKAFKGEL